MRALYSPESRAERLIAAGRVVLAASSLFAVWLDPTEPAKFASLAYGLLFAYVLYSGGLALLVLRSAPPVPWQRLLTHGFDLAFFSLFTYLTAGPASPFVAYFVFALVAATLRWQWRGTFWTALVCLSTFMSLGVYYAEVLRDPAFQLTPFVVRAVYLTVVAVLLGYLGRHEERTRREMGLLAAWPSHTTDDAPDAAVAELMENARRVLDSPSVAMVWTEREEPWFNIAWLLADGFSRSRESPQGDDLLPPAGVMNHSFLCLDPSADLPSVLVRSTTGLGRWRGRPLGPRLLRQVGSQAVLGLPLQGETIEGQLLSFGKAGMTSDDLLLGEVVAGIVTSRLDHVHLLRRLKAAAASDERERLARDLHDGVLQSFTGIGLQVAAARRVAIDQPKETAERLTDIQRLLADEQRDLRFFIEELTAPDLAGAEEEDAGDRLLDLARRIEQAFGVPVRVLGSQFAAGLASATARDLYNLVREAVVNAARHAAARQVEVVLERGEADRLRVTVQDDGRGFPFAGHFSLAELRRLKLGPRSLLERIGDARGDISVTSSPQGASVQMLIPLGESC